MVAMEGAPETGRPRGSLGAERMTESRHIPLIALVR
jgi:hypothetical protein